MTDPSAIPHGSPVSGHYANGAAVFGTFLGILAGSARVRERGRLHMIPVDDLLSGRARLAICKRRDGPAPKLREGSGDGVPSWLRKVARQRVSPK